MLLLHYHTKVLGTPHVKQAHSAIRAPSHESITITKAHRVNAASVVGLNLSLNRLFFYIPDSADPIHTRCDEEEGVVARPVKLSNCAKVTEALLNILVFEHGSIPNLISLLIVLNVPQLH